MTYRVDEKKWILYKHISDFNIISQVAIELKSNKSSIDTDQKRNLLLKLREMNFYNGRNSDMPLDSINHRINTLEFFMFGYKQKIGKEKKFMFSPLGNLFLKYIQNGQKEEIQIIFLTMLWALQFPHTYGGTDKSINLYPFRLIFKLLMDERLQCKIYSYEYSYLIAFTDSMDKDKYETLVQSILNLREKSNSELEILFNKRRHALVNAIHEWDYYFRTLFKQIGIFNDESGEVIFKIQHGNTNTFRKVTRNAVRLSSHLIEYVKILESAYPFDTPPVKLDDPERLQSDIIKEIHGFYPIELLNYIGEDDLEELNLLELPKLIEKYSNNNDNSEAYLFEDVLVEGFNMFYNIEANKLSGAGRTDIECIYLDENLKFAVDAKSTKNKLIGLKAGRLARHRELIGGRYTIVVTSRYVPAVKHDIKSTPNVILLAHTFSEFLYNCHLNNIRNIDFKDFHEIIINNLGKDISKDISNLTIEKFSISE